MKKWSLLCFMLPALLGATELDPWYGNELELEMRLSYHLQNYKYLHDVPEEEGPSSNLIYRPTTHHQLMLGYALNCFDWAGEVELGLSGSNWKPYGFEFLQVTGRYRLCNDIWEDWFSLTLGTTVRFTGKEARQDFSSYFHGRLEGEVHAALGREWACGCDWFVRGWGVLGAGIADRSKGWLFGEANVEFRVCPCHEFRLFAWARHGLGNEKLSTVSGFETYSPFAYDWLHTGARYTYHVGYWNAWSLEYGFGVIARNSPRYPHRLMLRYTLATAPV